MTVPVVNYVWPQGEDLTLSLIYKSGPDGAEVPVDLTNYSLRMDIVENGTRLYTFNSDDDVNDPTADQPGPADNEAVLGADGSINITVPRFVTLPGGEVFPSLAKNSVFDYDIFIRNKDSNKQQKVVRGQITVEPSYTLWI